MTYEVIVLREGHCVESETSGRYKVKCTITLIKGKHTILVDTGSAWDAQFLKEALRKHNVTPEQVNYVIGTHGHSDHIGNLNLFTEATHLVCYDINKGDDYTEHNFNQDCPYVIDEDLTVEATPGHTAQDISVFVHTEKYGDVVIAGDAFECEDDMTNPELWRNQSHFPEIQEDSRKRILERADYIVPGHGSMFKVPKSAKENSSVTINIIE